jgi:hypothetical protein
MQRRNMMIGALVVFGAIAWYAFRPERLFIDQTVDEPLAAEVSASDATTPMAAPMTLASGSFHGNAHETQGTATIYDVGGKKVLRLTGFSTSNGPDVHVYLVAAPDVTDDGTVRKAGYIDLGPMKGNRGDQNYDVPADIDLAKYRTATIWCARFSVNFGSAPLTAS